jgi:hypothetical protein
VRWDELSAPDLYNLLPAASDLNLLDLYNIGNGKLCKFAMFSRDSYLWRGIFNSSAQSAKSL